jgi:hypothetical protein
MPWYIFLLLTLWTCDNPSQFLISNLCSIFFSVLQSFLLWHL